MLQNIRYLPMEQSFLSNEIDTLEFPSRDSVQYGRRYQQKLLAFFWRSVFGETIRGSDPSTHVMTKSMICFFICNDPFVYCTKKNSILSITKQYKKSVYIVKVVQFSL